MERAVLHVGLVRLGPKNSAEHGKTRAGLDLQRTHLGAAHKWACGIFNRERVCQLLSDLMFAVAKIPLNSSQEKCSEFSFEWSILVTKCAVSVTAKVQSVWGKHISAPQPRGSWPDEPCRMLCRKPVLLCGVINTKEIAVLWTIVKLNKTLFLPV